MTINSDEQLISDYLKGDEKSLEILSILADLNKKYHQTIILVTHSEYAQKFADKVVKMKDGKIISS
jgi:putative ABC transport system ATP-binding protein